MENEGRARQGVIVALCFHVGILLACNAPTTGEVSPGGDTNMDPDLEYVRSASAPAIAPDESSVWLVHRRGNEYGTSWSRLAAVDPLTGAATNVYDTTDSYDRWMMFPDPSRALFLHDVADDEVLVTLDAMTHDVVNERVFPHRSFASPQMSPSGHYFAARENDSATSAASLVAVHWSSGHNHRLVRCREWHDQRDRQSRSEPVGVREPARPSSAMAR